MKFHGSMAKMTPIGALWTIASPRFRTSGRGASIVSASSA